MTNYHFGDQVASCAEYLGPLTVGIDPTMEMLPACLRQKGLVGIREFCFLLVDAASSRCGFIKPQSAFFEALGVAGIQILCDTIKYAKSKSLNVILDAKRGDIGSTAEAYASAYLSPGDKTKENSLEVDCITVNPFLGPDSLEPFTERSVEHGKGLFVLCKTSNPGASWLQDQLIDAKTVSIRVAEYLAPLSLETKGAKGLSSVGVVVGLTYPETGRLIRKILPFSVFLAPGFGDQGGKIGDVAKLLNSDGRGVLVPISRAIARAPDIHMTLEAYKEHVAMQIEKFKTELAAV